jgi:hypothetical protein
MRLSAAAQTGNERQRAKGLRPVQHWAPDTRSPEFLECARRECEALKNDPNEAKILDEIEALAAELLKDLPR